MKPVLLIDFDSTIVGVESLDLLSEIALADRHDGATRAAEIAEITRLGMEGKIGFRESLTKRLSLLEANRSQIPFVVERLKQSVTRSFGSHCDQIRAAAEDIYVISGSFREMVEPVVEDLGFKTENLFTNEFEYDEAGRIVGFDASNPLSQDGGKAEVAAKIRPGSPRVVIGDGFTDYQIRESGNAEKFYYFAEAVQRPAIMALADRVVYGIDEVLAELEMPTRYSFPRSKMRVLLLDDIERSAEGRLLDEGYRVDWSNEEISEDRLLAELEEVSVLGVRTRTKLPKRVLEGAKKLQAIGVFAVGLDHVDTKFAAAKGIAVFNAPYSNTRSVVELAIGEIIMLLRHVPTHNRNMHAGEWLKFAEGSYEVRGKKLGIVGYGNIGSQLSVLAESMGMEVVYFDLSEKLTLGNARKMGSLNELLKQSDVVTVHVDGRPSNKGLFGAAEFAAMKDGAIFLNLSRGGVVDLAALRDAVLSGKVGGCGVDVFADEPKVTRERFESSLQGLENVLLTPHISGSTIEAQRNIASFVSDLLVKFLATGETLGSVSLPELHCPRLESGTRILHIHENVPGLVASVSSILAQHGVNIVAQNLGTRDAVGYLVTDVMTDLSDEVIADVRSVPGTIRLRVVKP